MNEVENAVAEIIEYADVDFATADITMPGDYEMLVMANERVGLVRSANVLKLQAAATKALNPQQADASEKAFRNACWQIALIDRNHPKAKALSLDIMQRTADQELKVLQGA